MTEQVIAHMRARIARTRRVISLARAEEMIAALEAMIEEAEADIRRLEEMAARKSLSDGQSAEPFLLTPERPAD
jgi:predicted  nucleic acid-binding Zn-ribbon protein